MARTTNPKCNHCGYEFSVSETWNGDAAKIGYVHTGDRDMSDLICPNDDCKKTFHVSCVHEIFFDQLDSNGDVI